MHDEKMLDKYEELAYKELGKIVEKGELTPQTLANVKELLCTLKYVPEVKQMHHMDDGMSESSYGYGMPRYYDIRSYDGYSYDNGMSERRGRSPMTGRYVSRDDGRMSGTYPMGMSGTNQIQPDMSGMLQQLMDRMDRLEKK